MRWPAEPAARVAVAAGLALALAACGPAPGPEPVVPFEQPKAVDTPPPGYPEAAACEGGGGVVDLRVTIGPDGRVGDVRLARGSGHQALDQAAIDAVRGWTFEPARRGGTPVAYTIAVPMTFNAPAERPDRCFALDEERRRSGAAQP